MATSLTTNLIKTMRRSTPQRLVSFLVCSVLIICCAEGDAEETDFSTHELTIAGTNDDKLQILARHLPAESPQAVVIISHGLGGSRHGYTYLSEGLAAAGFLVLHLQHTGSDNAVWEDVPRLQRLAALKNAASGQQAIARMTHVKQLLQALLTWHKDQDHPLHQSIDLQRIAIAGHSFGSVTTLSMLGQRFGNLPAIKAPQLKAGIALSPSPSRRGSNAEAFGRITTPILCITGNQDTSIIQERVTAASREEVFAALPTGQAYQLVYDEGKHGDFSDSQRNSSDHQSYIHRSLVPIAVDFLQAYLHNDQEAKVRLEAQRPELREVDSWQWK